MIEYSWLGETFILHAERCMYWANEKMLILSDLHLGKSGHFRKEGIGIPQQVYQKDISRLFSLINSYQPDQVMMVGDLFHSRVNKEWDGFAEWRAAHAHIRFTLVKGNHDVLPAGIADAMQLEVTTQFRRKNFLFVHNADDITGSEYDATGLITGHIHPAVRVASGARQQARLPCFHFAHNTCTLPAFSLFTGSHTIKPKSTDRVFVIAGTEVIPL